jgi:RNA polymerase sigma-70 factor (ECF subfamily)
VLTADETVARIGVARALRGAAEVAAFSRYARGATPALLDGAPAGVWLVAGRPRVVYRFTTRAQTIAGIELIADPDRLAGLDLEVLGLDA